MTLPGIALERFGVRYGATVVVSVARTGVAFLTGILVARALGAAEYGKLYFLLGTFLAVRQLLDGGAASAYFTLLARQPGNLRIVAVYLAWIFLQFGVTLVIVAALLPDFALAQVWLGESRSTVVVACGASFVMLQLWGLLDSLGEARRKTVIVQGATLTQAFVHLALVTVASRRGWLDARAVLWMLMAEYLVMAAFVWRLLRVGGSDSGRGEDRAVIRDFIAYCRPLVLYGWAGFAYDFTDRWMLQHFAGAAQQGFFAVGQQFSAVVLIATTSLLKVFWQEVAAASHEANIARVRALYTSATRGLYFGGAWLSCLVVPYSREILSWTVGDAYMSAWQCLALMFVYPVHQSLGQISGIYFYATGRTRIYSRIGIATMLGSLPITYVLLAPTTAPVPGLSLGAVGLALKLVALQLLAVTAQTYVIAREGGWSHDLGRQAAILAGLLAITFTSWWVSGELLGIGLVEVRPIQAVVLGVGLFVGSTLLLLRARPDLAGLTAGQWAAV